MNNVRKGNTKMNEHLFYSSVMASQLVFIPDAGVICIL